MPYNGKLAPAIGGGLGGMPERRDSGGGDICPTQKNALSSFWSYSNGYVPTYPADNHAKGLLREGYKYEISATTSYVGASYPFTDIQFSSLVQVPNTDYVIQFGASACNVFSNTKANPSALTFFNSISLGFTTNRLCAKIVYYKYESDTTLHLLLHGVYYYTPSSRQTCLLRITLDLSAGISVLKSEVIENQYNQTQEHLLVAPIKVKDHVAFFCVTYETGNSNFYLKLKSFSGDEITKSTNLASGSSLYTIKGWFDDGFSFSNNTRYRYNESTRSASSSADSVSRVFGSTEYVITSAQLAGYVYAHDDYIISFGSAQILYKGNDGLVMSSFFPHNSTNFTSYMQDKSHYVCDVIDDNCILGTFSVSNGYAETYYYDLKLKQF